MKTKFIGNGTKTGVVAMALLLGAGTVTGTGMSILLPGAVEAKETSKEQQTLTNNMSSVQVIGESTTWKYLDNNTDPAEGKDSREFDTSFL